MRVLKSLTNFLLISEAIKHLLAAFALHFSIILNNNFNKELQRVDPCNKNTQQHGEMNNLPSGYSSGKCKISGKGFPQNKKMKTSLGREDKGSSSNEWSSVKCWHNYRKLHEKMTVNILQESKKSNSFLNIMNIV